MEAQEGVDMWDKNIGVVPHGGVPCKDCPKKGCGTYHDVCPEYQAYRAKVDEIHKKFNVEREKDTRSPKRPGDISPFAITRTHKHMS